MQYYKCYKAFDRTEEGSKGGSSKGLINCKLLLEAYLKYLSYHIFSTPLKVLTISIVCVK
jgi:hypothetical protein